MTAPLRSHEYATEVGEFRNPPLMQPSVSPTTGVPSSVGGATATGEAGGVSPASTLT